MGTNQERKGSSVDSDDKLRREIRELSQLIAASNSGGTSTNQVNTTSRTASRFNIGQYPPTFRQSYSLLPGSSRGTTSRNLKHIRYPNPFDQFRTGSYIDQVFSKPSSSTDESLNKSVALSRDTSHSSPYRLNNNTSTGSVSANFSRLPLASTSTQLFNLSVSNNNSTAVMEKAENKPVSIYINPSYLTKYNSTGESSMSLSLSQRGVRPHINPAHSSFQLLASSSGSNNPQLNSNFVEPASSTSVSFVYNHNPVQSLSNTLSSTNHCDNENQSLKARTLRQVTNTNASCTAPSVKTKYKLDRREKRSPVRKVTKARNFSSNKLLASVATPKTKLFKRYSMRTVSASKYKYSLSSWKHQRFDKVKTATQQQQHLNRKLSRPYLRPRAASLRATVAERKAKGSKSVVHIDGSKFITKNGGKTLKRMSSKMNVVSINGSRFIRKNGGKSLKRLSESGGKCKPVLSILSQQQQTPGVRLANRAVQRSKVTLSQRIWKKKRFCVFYNRFGECKRREDGNCPYIHDQKQLMICPKFIVGKCTNKDCKLSHDLKVGRMPPCQFFNKSKCSRENCPYPHVKTSPFTKKTAEIVKRTKDQANQNGDGETVKSSPPRKKKSSQRKESSKSPIKVTESKKSKVKRVDPKSRYYEQSPVSQPVVSIIPRRLPKLPSTGEKEPVVLVSKTETVPSTSTTSTSANFDSDENSSSVVGSSDDGRRVRLMSRISRLHERMKKKESTAPQFLPFN